MVNAWSVCSINVARIVLKYGQFCPKRAPFCPDRGPFLSVVRFVHGPSVPYTQNLVPHLRKFPLLRPITSTYAELIGLYIISDNCVRESTLWLSG